MSEPTSRLAFWRHLPQHEGRHSVATAAWANLFSRCAAIHAPTSGLTLVPRRKCPNSRPGHCRVSWLFFKARATSISKWIREDRATRKNSQPAAARRVAMKMGPAAVRRLPDRLCINLDMRRHPAAIGRRLRRAQSNRSC